jgi:hypothetical protein
MGVEGRLERDWKVRDGIVDEDIGEEDQNKDDGPGVL